MADKLSGGHDLPLSGQTPGALPEALMPSTSGLEDLLGYARAHAATGDTRVWVDDLERMLSVAWELMTDEQRLQFREHAETAALIEAAGQSPLPP